MDRPEHNGRVLLEDKLRDMLISSSAGGPEGVATNADLGAIGETGPSQSPKPQPKKRLNQATRRQMSAQLSIPIDPRPVMTLPGHQPLYSSPPVLSHHQGPGYHHQRPHSATFQPSYQQQKYQHHGQMSHSVARGGGFGHPNLPPHHMGHHHQSRSYNENTFQSDHGSWRSPPSQTPLVDPAAFGRANALPPPHFNGAQPPSGPGLAGPSPSPGTPGRPNLAGPQAHGRQPFVVNPEGLQAQAALLGGLCDTIIKDAEISYDEILRNERFRVDIERICQTAIAMHELQHNNNVNFHPASVQLRCFGSLSSGFATKASDMDLGLLSPLSRQLPDDPNSPIPRLIEKAFLDAGLGARLLTRTRVPIIKLCERPPEKLRQALLETRAKWERGEEEDPHEHDGGEEGTYKDDEAPRSPIAVNTGPVAVSSGPVAVNNDTVPVGSGPVAVSSGTVEVSRDNGDHDSSMPVVPAVDSKAYRKKLDSLKQGSGTDLYGYHNAAKRMLQKLGGREIRQGNFRDLDDTVLGIVTDVSRAFVRGLVDDELRRRLAQTRSASFLAVPPYPSVRSLLGVYWQAEGESLAIAWERRQVREKDARVEADARAKFAAWAELQDRPSYGLDPAGFARELQLAAEGLRRYPSVMLSMLKQAQHESPSDYHARAARLILDLGIQVNAAGSASEPVRAAIRHYVMGIWGQEVRAQVTGFMEFTGSDTLRAVARRHKSLQLARDFEKVLEKDRGVYDVEDRKLIRQYIVVLRRPMKPSVPPHYHFDFVVPILPEDVPMLSQIKTLPDPAKTSANQPRDPYRDRLEFPKTGAGVQCDINFSAHLALQNTLLLRCYSHTDPRVRPLVLFVKHWAKVRGINTPYRGTLSSYGYVLMMLHFLVNIATPFVCPNLQQLAPPLPPEQLARMSREEIEATVECRGKDVRFWRDEDEIKSLAAANDLNQNRDSIGHLLRCFFEYYAHHGQMSTLPCRGFDWGRDALSLRTPGGLRTKQSKGWTSAKTVHEVQKQRVNPQQQPQQQQQQPNNGPGGEVVKEIRHRYLFAIEDPFELEHNVARTVTHNGIVSIRDEFRRAWSIIKEAGKALPKDGGGGGDDPELLRDVATEQENEKSPLADLMSEIHGRGLAF